MGKKKKPNFSVDKAGENAEIKIVTDVLGTGEMSKSISEAYNNTIKDLSNGFKMFLISMIVIFVGIIIAAYLKIEALSSLRFDLIIISWFVVFISCAIISFVLSFLAKHENDSNPKNKK